MVWTWIDKWMRMRNGAREKLNNDKLLLQNDHP